MWSITSTRAIRAVSTSLSYRSTTIVSSRRCINATTSTTTASGMILKRKRPSCGMMMMHDEQTQRQLSPSSRTLTSATTRGWSPSSSHLSSSSSSFQSLSYSSRMSLSSSLNPLLVSLLDIYKTTTPPNLKWSSQEQQQHHHHYWQQQSQQQRPFSTTHGSRGSIDDDEANDDFDKVNISQQEQDDIDDDPASNKNDMGTRIPNYTTTTATSFPGHHQQQLGIRRPETEKKLVELRRRLLLCRMLHKSSSSLKKNESNSEQQQQPISDDGISPEKPPKILLKKSMDDRSITMAKLLLEGQENGGEVGEMKKSRLAAAVDAVASATTAAAGESTTADASNATTNTRKTRKRIPARTRRQVLHPDRLDFYSTIRQKQVLQKEAGRVKTAQNVHRALCGNVVICMAKFGAYISSGSSSMLAEFIHSVVDCGNQALLLVGLQASRLSADGTHNYGYGKSVYFWALVSALGTFFLGFGVSMTHAVHNVMDPSLQEITWHVWSVLLLSLVVDGYVLQKTVSETYADKPANMSYWKHVTRNIRDPATLAVLLEDGAACLGVVLALGGIAASHVTGNPIFDGVAGIGISALLGCMGVVLVRMNHRFLLGQAVDDEITQDIARILLARRSVDSIGAVQSQWTGPETFSYKCEVDFDGTYLAAQLMKYYQNEFLTIRDTMDDELQVLLALYAEDVMRSVEREVRHVEALIRSKYPGAEYIELEPFSLDADRLAIDDNLEEDLRKIEEKTLDRFLKSLREKPSVTASVAESSIQPSTTADETHMHLPADSSSSVFSNDEGTTNNKKTS